MVNNNVQMSERSEEPGKTKDRETKTGAETLRWVENRPYGWLVRGPSSGRRGARVVRLDKPRECELRSQVDGLEKSDFASRGLAVCDS